MNCSGVQRSISRRIRYPIRKLKLTSCFRTRGKKGEKHPLHEIGSAEQVAETVLFLLTGPQFINGDCIMLDGGRMWKRGF